MPYLVRYFDELQRRQIRFFPVDGDAATRFACELIEADPDGDVVFEILAQDEQNTKGEGNGCQVG